LVTFSSKGKQHSVEKLVENLRKLHLMRNQDEVWLFLNITELSIVDTLADGAAFNKLSNFAIKRSTVILLGEKDDIKQNSIVTSARKQNAYMINQRKERKQQLLKDHQKIIQEKESAKKLKLEKKEKENNKMRENMAKIGILNDIKRSTVILLGGHDLVISIN
jgi:hypothetical protein